jgi:Kef-type K+ transport system membrane component KefB
MFIDATSITQDVLLSLGMILIFATILAFIVRLFKQPLVPAYILAGLILGPLGFGLIKEPTSIRIMSELGIAFLLFVVGLEIDIRKLRHVGLVSTLGGFLQVAISFALGFYIASLLGFSQFESIVLGLVLAFSSTMIVVKLLADSEEIDTLHGRIILGILIVQDILVILALSFITTANNLNAIFILTALIRGFILFASAYLTGRYVFPKLFQIAAKSQEVLFLSSLTVLFLFAILADLLSFSIAIGSFVAGLSLANLPYNIDVVGRVKPLKTFFATIFFVSLGMQLSTIPQSLLKNVGIFLLLIILVKPLLIFLITYIFKYERRTSFLTGLSLGQTSEFSLILVMVPFVLANISSEVFSMVILLTIVTMILTSYLVEFREYIYEFFNPLLKLFEKVFGRNKPQLEYIKKNKEINFVLCGKHRMGSIIYKHFKNKRRLLVIDNNPDVISKLMKEKAPCIYGDIRNAEVLDKLNLRKIKTIISTVPDVNDNAFLLKYIKSKNKKINIIVTANHNYEAIKLYELGADYVIMPHLLSGERVTHMIQKFIKRRSYLKSMSKRHLTQLAEDY